MEQKAKDKDKDSPELQSSTTRELSIYHSDDEDVFIIRIDAKDSVRRQVMAAVQAALEQAKPPRDAEASKAKAYAQEKLPDDWRRKSVSKGDPDDSNATRAYRQPGEQQHAQYGTDKDRDQQRQREAEAKKR